MEIQDELPLDHEPSLNYWAKLRATQEMEDGCYTNWDHAYETEWHYLDYMDWEYIAYHITHPVFLKQFGYDYLKENKDD